MMRPATAAPGALDVAHAFPFSDGSVLQHSPLAPQVRRLHDAPRADARADDGAPCATSSPRARLLQIIERQPGIPASTLYRRAGLPAGSGHHHVRKLLEFRLVHARRLGRFHLLYPGPPAGSEPVDVAGAALLRCATARSLARAIVRDPGVGLQALCQRLGLGSRLVRYHVRRFVEADLVTKNAGRIYCHLAPAPRLVALLREP